MYYRNDPSEYSLDLASYQSDLYTLPAAILLWFTNHIHNLIHYCILSHSSMAKQPKINSLYSKIRVSSGYFEKPSRWPHMRYIHHHIFTTVLLSLALYQATCTCMYFLIGSALESNCMSIKELHLFCPHNAAKFFCRICDVCTWGKCSLDNPLAERIRGGGGSV